MFSLQCAYLVTTNLAAAHLNLIAAVITIIIAAILMAVVLNDFLNLFVMLGLNGHY